MNDKKELQYNGSGAYDPTPYDALTNINRASFNRSGKVVKALQEVAHLAGYEIVGRIVLKDKMSGDIFK